MKVTILSCSLNPKSKSFILSEMAQKQAVEKNLEAELIDVRKLSLPLSDGGACYANSEVIELTEKLKQSDIIIVAAPIYNYDLSSISKMIVEMCGDGFKEKVVGLIASAGGEGSYLSFGQMMVSLIMHYHAYLIPQVIYGSKRMFDNEIEKNEGLIKRIDRMFDEGMRLANAV